MREVGKTLERVRKRCDQKARLDADPVGVVHRFADPQDKEIVGLLAACVAFGNVVTIRSKLLDALRRIGDRPTVAAEDEAKLLARMKGWKHRVFLGEDIARLLVGARRVQKANGTLGERFRKDYDATHDLREALARFTGAIRDAGNLHASSKGRRGPSHLLGNPRGASASKRLLLYLRWMIRPADGVDLGLWPLPASILLCPVDTHIHKLGRNLGFTTRKDLSWRTTEEIGRALAAFDPSDPAKYDFALCHLGMLQRCPSRRDPVRCEGCGVMPVCKHWSGAF
jgi:uncharacterized protein (TIGR02757 family)